MKYAFMREHEQEFRLRSMCRVFGLHPSGYYAWLASPLSARGKDDLRALGVITHCWLESGGEYGYGKLSRDLHDLGEACGKHRIARCAERAFERRWAMAVGQAAVAAKHR